MNIPNPTHGAAQTDRSALLHFRVTPREAQQVAVRRLALAGMRDTEIAASTGWPVDWVRHVVNESPGDLAAALGSRIPNGRTTRQSRHFAMPAAP